MQLALSGTYKPVVASVPGLPRFYLPFAFTIIHGNRRPFFLSVYYCSTIKHYQMCLSSAQHSNKIFLQWHTMSADPPAITFVDFIREKYLLAVSKYIMVIPTCPHCMQGKHLM